MTTPEQKNNNETITPIKNQADVIPPQYKGMPSEIVEELWQNPIFVDEEKNISETERRQQALDEIKKAEANREKDKQKYLTERYVGLSEEQKNSFPIAKSDASKILHEHIRGKREADSLSSEECFVIGKLRIAYEDFKKDNPDKPFNFDFSKDIDRSVYNNLAQRLAFKVLEDNQKVGDQEKANIIRQDLGIPLQEVKTIAKKSEARKPEMLSTEERKKYSGWEASYELAKIAITQGIDLSNFSREDYMKFAIDNSLAIDDDQLRMAPWQRMKTSIEQLLTERKMKKAEIEGCEEDKAFTKFEIDTKIKAGEQDKYISEKVRVRSGTKDSNSWLYFGINNGIDDKPSETYKSYISVRDIKTLTPEKFKSFMESLQKNQYNGDVKIFQDLAAQGVVLNDQIVMHGRSRADAELALQVAESFFGNDIAQKSLGKDEVINGKNMSYSQILADKIKKEISKK